MAGEEAERKLEPWGLGWGGDFTVRLLVSEMQQGVTRSDLGLERSGWCRGSGVAHRGWEAAVIA